MRNGPAGNSSTQRRRDAEMRSRREFPAHSARLVAWTVLRVGNTDSTEEANPLDRSARRDNSVRDEPPDEPFLGTAARVATRGCPSGRSRDNPGALGLELSRRHDRSARSGSSVASISKNLRCFHASRWAECTRGPGASAPRSSGRVARRAHSAAMRLSAAGNVRTEAEPVRDSP